MYLGGTYICLLYTDPIAVVEQCLQLRERRSHVDRCLDEVQSSLHDELRTLRQGEMVLGRTAIEAAEQIRLLRSAKFQLDRDLADKSKASEIDSTTVGLADSVVGDGRTPRYNIQFTNLYYTTCMLDKQTKRYWNHMSNVL